ncbi:MAG: CHAT domain-containing tetratricopeptide repeat protein [Vicinamibacteraceae bacterium]
MPFRPAACFVLALFAAAGPARAQTSAPPDAAALLLEAERAFQAGDRDPSLLEAVVARAQAESNVRVEAEARRRLASAYKYREQFDRAFDELQRVRDLRAASADRVGEARAVLAMGETRRAQGRTADALTLGRAAFTSFVELKDPQGIVDAAELVVYLLPPDGDHAPYRTQALAITDPAGRTLACGVLHEWGDGFFTEGRAAEAFARLSQAQECFHRVGERDREARSLVSLGRVYRLHGRLDEALARYQQALALHERPDSNDRLGAVQAMNAIAVTLSAMGRYDEAGAQYEAGLARARLTAPSVVPFFVANLGGFHLEQGRYAQALALLDEAIAAAPATQFLARRVTQRASALAGLGRIEEALAEFNRALTLARDRGPEDLVPIRRSRARFLVDAGRFAEAEEDLRALMAFVEEGRIHNVQSDVMRRGFIEARQDVFGSYVDLLGRQGKAEDALAVAERARARAFLDLRAQRAGDARLAAPATPADARRLATRYRSTIVAYWVGPTETSIWVVRPDHPPVLVRVPVRPARLTALVRATAGLDGDASAARGLLMTERAQRAPWRELERLLIAPIRSVLPRQPGSRLTIVPHGPLFALSFAGLRQADGASLLEQYDLHYVPAIAVLAEMPAATRTAATGTLVVGDPGPLEVEAGTEALPALPWARREADAVRLALGAPTTVLTGRDASETAVREALAGRRVLHFATHGVVSNAPSRPSYLALHPNAGADGRLLADEIYDLHLDADLVVLSACRTALGPVEGDGVIGFARAFLSAGARSVVATQWDVSDRVSYEVMREFYRRRAQGASKSRSLRGAQLAVLRALRAGTIKVDGAALPETPRLWAGFVLTGEP